MKIPIPPKVTCHRYGIPSSDQDIANLDVTFTGPPLSEGPLPAVLYLSLSAEESLCLDPFNQPVAFLQGAPLRVFSVTLPGHGKGFKNTEAMTYWANQLQKGNDLLGVFLRPTIALIKHLVAEKVIIDGHLVASGLSRGGFAALHLAALSTHITAVCAFAPLTDPTLLKEFASIADGTIMQSYALNRRLEKLVGKPISFFMGNRDLRVVTDACYRLSQDLIEANFSAGVRSPPVELHLFPSIGYKGHGTPPEIFYSGAQWMKQILL